MSATGEQWELAVWKLAFWAAGYQGRATICQGDVSIKCPVCKRNIPYSFEVVEGCGFVYCRSAYCIGADRPIPVAPGIAQTAFTEAMNVIRRLFGGVRGYALVHGLEVLLQAPVLHSTGNIANTLVFFILARMPRELEDLSKTLIRAVMSKSQMESLYLREFREPVAAGVACPGIFSEDLDAVFSILLQLVQLLNASWRGALTDKETAERASAAASSQISAALLCPLYQVLKPLDRKTKEAKVLTLYMHSAVAHVRNQVGDKRSPVSYVSDDLI